MTRHNIENNIQTSNMATTVTQRMGRLFSTTSVPANLQSDDLTDDIPKKRQSFSRVRKLSKRLSATFKSSLSLKEEDMNETENTTTLDHHFTHKKRSSNKKRTLGRVLSLQVFHDHQDFKEIDIDLNEETKNKMPITTQQKQQQQQQQQQYAYSTLDLSSTNSHEGLRRVLSVPASSSTLRSPSPYGKLEHYTKLEQLGEGSYATVYKGISKINNIFVALKEIRLQEEEGIPFTAIREDEVFSCIPCMHDNTSSENTDLCMFLEERPFGLHPFNTKLLLFQLLRGLCFIHKKQILHRDIKPQNVLLSNRGELKLADFGLARAKSVPSRTYTHEIVTLWYRPPDVLLGSTHYTTSLDIWGVGCIFVEMISGFPLFPGVKSARDQLTKIFKVCGTPNKSDWPDEINGYNRVDFNVFPKKSLIHQAPRLKSIPHAEALAEKMLQFEPRSRISAGDATHDVYFSDLPKAIHTLPSTTSIFVLPGLRMAEDHRRPESAKPKANTKSFGHFV